MVGGSLVVGYSRAGGSQNGGSQMVFFVAEGGWDPGSDGTLPGEMDPIWTSIFQMGWFNHQPEMEVSWNLNSYIDGLES